VVSVSEIDTLLAQEQVREARRRLAEVDAESRSWSQRLRAALLDARDYEVAIDETILRVEALLADPGAVDEERPRAHALRIFGFATKRSFALTERAVAEARDAVGAHPRVLLAEGRAMMRFDERERAHGCFEEAIAAGGETEGSARHALADALYVLGDFDGAVAQAAQVTDGPARLRALRLLASCAAARQDDEAEVAAWADVLEAGEGSDRAQDDRISYALALASAGRRADALEQLGHAWRADPESGPGRYARARMNHLERHLEGGRSKRLAAFPTTAQKWNYCGPAVLELCFRYLAVELTQDEIADTVKRQYGTPMYEIAAFLSAHEIAARRIEGTRARIMAALDLDLPVIVQEEYSTTSHVAVLIGYDEALGTFVAQDPATHRPMLKTFEFTERAGDLYGGGAIIVLGRAGPELSALEATCDEAGLVDAPHLRILDDADRLRPAVGGAREEASLFEVLRRCDEAIALKPEFKLAWHRRVSTRARLAAMTGRDDDRSAFLRDLHHVRTRFARDEWPHQLHANYLFDRTLRDEAYAEYLEASRIDPGDANNRRNLGECMWLSGDLERAERRLLEALARSPFDVRAAENLTAVYTRELIERQKKQPDAYQSLLAPSNVYERLSAPDAVILRRAEHFSRVALADNPSNPFDHEVAGDLAALAGDHEAARAHFERARERDPHSPFYALGIAQALCALERFEEAEAAIAPVTVKGRGPVRAFTLHAEVLERLGRGADAAQMLTSSLEGGGDLRLVPALFDVYRRLESREAAAARLRELAEQHAHDAELVRAVGELLDDEDQRGHAISLFRRVLAASPQDVGSMSRLGTMLSKDVLTRDESIALLERVVELAPGHLWSKIRLAWALAWRDPGRGLSMLEEHADAEQSFLHETRAALMARTGDAEGSAAALALSLRAFADPEAGLLDLVRWHVRENRYDRAIALAEQIEQRVKSDALRVRAEREWATAFRLGGRFKEALPRVRELCADGVPKHLAFDVYWGASSLDHALAGDAAAVYAESSGGSMTWRIRAAAERAHVDDAELIAVREAVADDDAESWAQLSYAYVSLKRFDEANAAAERAYAIDDANQEALSALEDARVRQGDVDAAIACAQRLAELYPYEHVGPERLGALLARKLERLEEALTHSHRAVDAAPFCHNAHWSRALALFATDDLEGAARHAERSLGLHDADADDDPNGSLMIRYALAGELERLDRCLQRQRERQPDVFAAFDAKLREVATARAG